jgi:simple sugar transport system ATP-binding protein
MRALGDYPIAVQQLVSIARALDRDARVLILDEPTSSLDRDEVARLFALMRELKTQGIAIVFVTHFLDQVFSVADSVTVLRNGCKVGDWSVESLNRGQLVSYMLGRELEDVPRVEHSGAQQREVLFQVDGLGKRGYLQPVSFDVRKGECLGLTGLLGSGRTETMKLIFGAVSPDSGIVHKSAKKKLRSHSVGAAIDDGIGFCPEDRKAEAIFPGMSVAENLLLVAQARRGWLRPLGKKKGQDLVATGLAKLQVKALSPTAPIETLSGGNQQKVVLARWLASSPELLLLDEPTRGIDVGSKFEIRKTIRELAAAGTSFVFSSSELEEVVNTCDRVVVLRDKSKVSELAGRQVSESNVMAAIAKAEE